MASEMTNEELAKHIECGDAILREAAARLRALSTLTTHTDNSEIIAELQRRLKVAEDAVVSMRKVFGHTGDTDAISMCDYALAAIRGEGGAE